MISDPRFPRSGKYNPEWIRASTSGGANALWMAEWLAEKMDLRAGMRVLDLGCGRAASSIFLHREFGVRVWATDLWFSAGENFERIRDAGASDAVFPVHTDARALPFAPGFFDAIVSIDSFPYYGTDDLYLNYLARFLKPEGQMGIAGAGLTREMGDRVPDHLREWWTQDLWSLHSAAWWRRHWERTGIVSVDCADAMEDGWKLWCEWHKQEYPSNEVEIRALDADRGEYLGYVRVVARRNRAVDLGEIITSLPERYERRELRK
jgi:cyclopropane fatty-acyl-phospholipid synthase-like methyltransferase